MSTIFVCYRRDDARHVAERIYDELVTKFGTHSVFKDVDDIPPGTDFRHDIEKKISQSRVLLVVIGQHWLQIKDHIGCLRLNDPRDYVRIEIETALKNNITVVPLLVDGAEMPMEGDLPDSIRELAYRQAIVIRPDPDFRRDLGRLTQLLTSRERFWLYRPERISEVGTSVIVIAVLLLMWHLAALAEVTLGLKFGFIHTANRIDAARKLAIVIIFILIPLLWIGVETRKRNKSALWAGLLLITCDLAITVSHLLGFDLILGNLPDYLAVNRAIFTIFPMLASIMILAYSVALFAYYTNRRPKR